MNRFNQYARAAGAAAILLGALVLLGWAFDVSLLKNVLPGKVAMRPNTAICFLLTGAALLLLVLAPAQQVVSATRRKAAVVCATLAATIALAALSEYLFRYDWGVDRLLVRNLVAADDSGRMAASTALGFVLLGGALLLLDARHKAGRLCSELLALATLLIGVIALLGYIYGIESLYGLFAYTPIAVHTAFLLVVVGLGVLFSRPESGLTSAITSERGGGVMARRVLPVAVLLLVALAWLHLRGGLVLFVTSGITILVVWVWLVARSLNLLDAKREQGLEALRLSEESLRLALDAAHLGTFDWDLPHNLLTWSRWHEEMWGFKPGEFAGTYEAFSERVHADDLPGINAEVARCIAARERFSREFRVVWPDGSVHWVASNGEFEFSAEGQPGRMRGAVMEITERKREEENLRRMATVVRDSNDAITIQDFEGRITAWNRGAELMYSYSEAEALLMNIERLTTPGKVAEQRDFIRRLIAGEAITSFETQRVTKDGRVLDVWMTVTKLLDDAGKPIGLASTERDITERKRAEESLRSKNEELASMTQQLWQASKLATMGELAASIAHELNNPLATVSLRAENLLIQLPEDSNQRKPLEIIAQEVDRMATLVNNLLQFSRRSHRQISTVDPREEVATSVEFVHYHLRSRNIEVAREFADGLPTIQADRQQLRQLFLNLLTNASDAMPQGGKLTLRATSSNLGDAKAVAIEVEDTGDGITAENLEKIWEPFFTTKPEGKGTGLGMGICRRIVEEHGGTIDIQSQAGHGTTIRLVFPATHGA